MRRRIIAAVFILMLVILFFWINGKANQVMPNELYDYYLRSSFVDTGAQNIVTAIYMHYRAYDTIFESFLILLGIIAIIHFSRHEGGE